MALAIVAMAVFSPASKQHPKTPAWLPNPRRQVSSEVARNGVRGLAAFGVQMGLGFRTFIPARSPYVVVALAALGCLGTAGAIAAGFGFSVGRLVPVAIATMFGEDGLIRLSEATPTASSPMGRVTALVASASLIDSLPT